MDTIILQCIRARLFGDISPLEKDLDENQMAVLEQIWEDSQKPIQPIEIIVDRPKTQEEIWDEICLLVANNYKARYETGIRPDFIRCVVDACKSYYNKSNINWKTIQGVMCYYNHNYKKNKLF